MISVDLLTIELLSVALVARSVTAVAGLFVATLAYRGYRRNDSTKMRALAVGIGLLTAGVYVAVVLADLTGAGSGIVLLVRGLVTVAGLCVVLYAMVAA
ncbi:DUF7521 family protein [Halorubrum halodurans]|uniref:Uncharacterized protein n=1 Tax=Halorubrum halodurans TaxID=1383851 RepID=A0A256IJT1_9EURY|nr:hypothetical protein [Halorubrum halodurans]OYR56785.1 hypothetical protein DJ70_07725 [Halorubrum halodurans]